MAKSNFIVRGGADFSGIKNEIDKTQKQFKGFQLNLKNGLKAIGKMAGITLGAKALIDFGKAAIKTSSDLEEIQNVTDTVFKSMAKDVDEFSKTLIESHGIGELSAKKYASYMGAMLKSSGIQGDVMKQMSKDLTLLTADMASFYNLETEEMFQKIMSGMSGATMPLKKLGINMNIANLEAFALSQGIQKSWQEMSQAEQVMLRYNYLMAVTGDAQGDFTRNNWNWAHSVKILKEKWQEFLGIIGRGLQKVILPLVKLLIKVLDLLIKLATTIEKIFVMITGKKVDVEPRQVGIVDDYTDTIGDLGDFADDAAKNQKKLGKGIKDAAKAAKRALAPFDELNILQQNLSGGSKGGAGGVGGGFGSPFDGINFNNDFKMNTVGDSIADGFNKAKDEGNKFFIWLGDKWNGLKQMLAIPIMVAEPVFPKIPIPIYEPVWNLFPPPVPAVDYSQYVKSLETLKIKTAEIWEKVRTDTEKVTGKISTGLSTAWNTIETNFKTHRQNVGVIAAGIATTLVANIGSGLTTTGRNLIRSVEVMQNNLQTFGRNVATIAIGTARGFASNIGEGFRAAGRSFSSYVSSQASGLRSLGSGFLRASAETARGFVSNMVSGFQTVWSNFRNLMSGMGERVGGWFSANRSVITRTAIGVGIAAGVGAIAIAAPAAIPYISGGLAGLASIPAFAQGGYVKANNPMLAIVGDNRYEGEVITPESKIYEQTTKAIRDAGGNAQIIEIHFGNDIYRKIINGIEQEGRRSGRTIITMG